MPLELYSLALHDQRGNPFRLHPNPKSLKKIKKMSKNTAWDQNLSALKVKLKSHGRKERLKSFVESNIVRCRSKVELAAKHGVIDTAVTAEQRKKRAAQL
jgi:hypothetical protein